MINPSTIASLAFGLAALTLGRRLFWMFIAIVGFTAGIQYTPFILDDSSEVLRFIAAFVLGVIGALIAVFFQKVAIALVGLAAGGHIFVHVAQLLGARSDVFLWSIYGLGALAGAVLMLLFFDWALITISSLVGALMVTGVLHLSDPATLLSSAALAAVGTLVQGVAFVRARSNKHPPPSGTDGPS